MSGALLAIAAIAAAAIAFAVATREPSERASLAIVIASAGVLAGALTARALVWLTARGMRRRARAAATLVALRRGAEVGGAVALLALLRAIDGLTLITAAFVILAFGLAEAVLSARTT